MNLLALVDRGHLVHMQVHCPWRGSCEEGPFDYHYVVGLLESDPPNWIIAFDDPGNHPDGSGCVAYLDGSVRHHEAAEFAQELQRFQQAFEVDRGFPPTILGRDQPFIRTDRERLAEQQKAAYRKWLRNMGGP